MRANQTWAVPSFTPFVLIFVALGGCAGSYSASSPPTDAGPSPTDDSDSDQIVADAGLSNAGPSDAGVPSDGAINPTPAPGPGPNLETCGNGFDEDLDGQVDEQCSCTPGDTQACFPGLSSQLVGACLAGTQTCSPSALDEFGMTWGACEAAVAPTTETCGDGVDSDCDGSSDCDDTDCGVCLGQCELTHDFAVTPVIDAPNRLLADCGPNCVSIVLGDVGFTSGGYGARDNSIRVGAECRLRERTATFTIHNPAAITSAILDRAEFDDYLQVWVNKSAGHPVDQDQLVYQYPVDRTFRGGQRFPFFKSEPDNTLWNRGNCDRGTNWRRTPTVNLTPHFQQAEGSIKFTLRLAVDGEGEVFTRIRLNYNSTPTFTPGTGWAESVAGEGCFRRAQAVGAGTCTGTVTCVDGPDADGCITHRDGSTLCEADVATLAPEPPAPGLPRLCRRAVVDVVSCP